MAADRGITLVRGHGRLGASGTCAWGDQLLRASRASSWLPEARSIPPMPGLADAEPWTNREVTTASAIPDSLLVLGGGVVGWRWRRRMPRWAPA